MLKTFYKFIIPLFLSTFIAIPVQSQAMNTEGDLQKISSDRIWAQTLEGSHFNEFWNYQFYFDNGMKAHIVFSAANFGSLKSPVTGVRVSVYDPEKNRVFQVSREYPIEYLVQDRENYIFKLRPGRDIYFEGKLPEEHRVVVKLSKDGVRYDIDLRLDNIMQGYTLGDGKFKIRDESIGIVTHIPYAEASGHITINNEKKPVKGSAYMDHTHQHQTTTRLMHSGYRFVHHADCENWDVFYFLLPSSSNNNRTVGYSVRSEDGKITLKKVENLSVISDGKAFGKTFPRIIEFTLSDQSTIRIARSKDIERFSILGELGRIARRAARTFLGGEVVDFRGEGTLVERSQRPLQGDYNFFFVE